jgi:hypothetical protein
LSFDFLFESLDQLFCLRAVFQHLFVLLL